MSVWSVYLIRCADGSLYTGITTDVERRLLEHSGLGGRGAKYLKGRGPLELVWRRGAADRSEASRLEVQIKRLSKARKESLARNPEVFVQLLESLTATDS